MLEEKAFLLEILAELQSIKNAILALPEWISLSDIAEEKGLTRQAIRKQLLSGDYEPDVDFKYIGNKMYVARSVVPRIKRKRNGKQ